MRREVGIYKRRRRLNLSGLPTVIFTLLTCLSCWAIGYHYSIGFPVKSGYNPTPLWIFFCSLLTNKSYTFLVGFFLLSCAAILLQRASYILMIIREKNLLPLLFFLLLNSTNAEFFPVHPTSVVIFFVILAFFELFSSYQNTIEIGRSFNMMVYLCAGSLIWPYTLWFIPLLWFGMYKFRCLSPRTFVSSILGVFTTFWFVLGWCVWKHDFSLFSTLIQSLTDIHFLFDKESIQIEWLVPLCVFFLMIVASIQMLLHEFESTLRIRQFLSFLLTFSIYSFILPFFYKQNLADFLCVFYLPVSTILAYSFSRKNGRLSFLLYYLILFFLILLLFVHLWNSL